MPRTRTTLLALTFAGVLALGLAGCGSGTEDPPPSPTTTPTPEAVEFDPRIEVTGEATTVLELTDADGTDIELTTPYPDVAVTGVEPDIADAFTSDVTDNLTNRVDEQLQEYTELGIPECADEVAGTDDPCLREATFEVEHADVYEDYGTVATRTSFTLGSRDRNNQVHSVTTNLRTDETAELSEFLDPVGDSRAVRSLEAAENWALTCGEETPEEYLAAVKGFYPSENGVTLLWSPNPTYSAQCQVDEVLVPWTMPEESEQPTAADVNGDWCPTEDSVTDYGCATIVFPTATFDDGSVWNLYGGDDSGDGGFSFSTDGAPFGTYYPAGIAIDTAGTVTDSPDHDRIWSSQSGMMLVRQ